MSQSYTEVSGLRGTVNLPDAAYAEYSLPTAVKVVVYSATGNAWANIPQQSKISTNSGILAGYTFATGTDTLPDAAYAEYSLPTAVKTVIYSAAGGSWGRIYRSEFTQAHIGSIGSVSTSSMAAISELMRRRR